MQLNFEIKHLLLHSTRIRGRWVCTGCNSTPQMGSSPLHFYSPATHSNDINKQKYFPGIFLDTPTICAGNEQTKNNTTVTSPPYELIPTGLDSYPSWGVCNY